MEYLIKEETELDSVAEIQAEDTGLDSVTQIGRQQWKTALKRRQDWTV